MWMKVVARLFFVTVNRITAEHLHEMRNFPEMVEGIANPLVIDSSPKIDKEMVFPGFFARWLRLDSGQIDITQRKYSQGFEKRSRYVLHGESNRCFCFPRETPGLF
jgi:hypothetical protein